MSSSYRNTLENWLKELDVKADRVLDIGGSQLPVKGRTKTWDVKDYKIADLPNPHVDSPKPDYEVDINSPSLVLNNVPKSDLIFCFEVFEYVWNPVAAMAHISTYLADSGSAWVTFPAFYPLHQPVEDDALRYMPGGIKKLALATGIEIVQMIPRRPETNALLQYFSAERLRAAKGEDHMFMGYIVEMRKNNGA